MATGEMSINSFKQMIAEEKDESILLDLFKRLDFEKKGFVNVDDLTLFLHKLNIDLEKHDLYGIMRKLSPNNTGRISFNDFYRELGKINKEEELIKKEHEVKKPINI